MSQTPSISFTGEATFVQRTSNTRYEGPGDPKKTIPNIDLVQGLHTAVLFGLDGTNLESLTGEVTIEIQPAHAARQTFTVEAATLRAAVADGSVHGLVDAIFNSRPPVVDTNGFRPLAKYPVFQLGAVSTTDVTLVRVGRERSDIDGAGAGFVLSTKPATVDPITIGVAPVTGAPLDSMSADAYRRRVRAFATNLQRVYPVPKVHVYRRDMAGAVPFTGDSAAADSRNVEAAVRSGLPVTTGGDGAILTVEGGDVVDASVTVNAFDLTVGIVPADYFQYYNMAGLGMHWLCESGDAQPIMAALLRIDSGMRTGLMEPGHHFVGQPYRGLLGQTETGTHASRSLRSTAYDLAGGLFKYRPNSPSMMHQGTDVTFKTGWLDELAGQIMIEHNFAPVPEAERCGSLNPF